VSTAYDLVVSEFRRSPAALIDLEDVRNRHHLTKAEIEGIVRVLVTEKRAAPVGDGGRFATAALLD
jgi:hypothetical protein